MANKVFKRTLTQHQSVSCELAQKPRCTCRCNGLLHGVGHAQYMQIEADYIRRNGQITQDKVEDIIAFVKEYPI